MLISYNIQGENAPMHSTICLHCIVKHQIKNKKKFVSYETDEPLCSGVCFYHIRHQWYNNNYGKTCLYVCIIIKYINM